MLAAYVLTTVSHLSVVAFQRTVLRMFSWNWSEPGEVILTMGGYAIAFGVISAVVLPLHLAFPRFVSQSRAAGAMAAVSTFGVLLLIQGVSPWAWMVVAAGVGVRVGSLPWGELPMPRPLRSLLAVSGLALVLVVTMLGFERARERLWMAQLPLPAAGSPNVLLLILDTVRARSLGMYGADLATTPRLDEWAERGAVFEQAYSTAPWTLPSHASIFTGQYASRQSADWLSPLDTSDAVLAEWFRDHGYVTGGFTANLIATGHQSGLARGFGRYRATTRSAREIALKSTFAQAEVVQQVIRGVTLGFGIRHMVRHALRFDWRPFSTYNIHERKDADRVLAEFEVWKATAADRPWFAFVNLFDAHHPYVSPAPFQTMFSGGTTALDQYNGSIRYMDDRIGKLLDRLEQDGSIDNTIIVIASDHGELFGEHDLRGHGNSLYLPLLHVPLIVIAPGRVPEAMRITGPVSLRDLGATLQELVLDSPAAVTFPGTSLAPLLNGKYALPSVVVSEVSRGINDLPRNPTFQGDMIATIDDSLHVIRHSNDSVEAFHFRTDPQETDDIARQTAGRVEARRHMSTSLRRSGLNPPGP